MKKLLFLGLAMAGLLVTAISFVSKPQKAEAFGGHWYKDSNWCTQAGNSCYVEVLTVVIIGGGGGPIN